MTRREGLCTTSLRRAGVALTLALAMAACAGDSSSIGRSGSTDPTVTGLTTTPRPVDLTPDSMSDTATRTPPETASILPESEPTAPESGPTTPESGPTTESVTAASAPAAESGPTTVLPGGGTPTTDGVPDAIDLPDDAPGRYQVHVLAVLPRDAVDPGWNTDGRSIGDRIETTIAAANRWLAGETGGSTIRFDTFQGVLDASVVTLPLSSAEIYQAAVDRFGDARFIRDIVEAELDALGVFQPGKVYLGLVEIDRHPSTCADAAHPPDLMGRFAAIYPSAVVEAGWTCSDANAAGNLGAGSSYADMAVIHEIVHLLGFAGACGANPADAANTSHTGDSNADLMWAPGPDTPPATPWDTDEMRLDPGNDDYFRHGRADCPDLANSAFLDPLPLTPEPPPGWPPAWQLS